MIKTRKKEKTFWVRNKNNNNNNKVIWVWTKIKIKQRTIQTRDTLISSRKRRRKCPHLLLKAIIVTLSSSHRLLVLIKYPWTNKIPTLIIEITIITHTLNILMKAIIKAINPLNPPSQSNKPYPPSPNTVLFSS